MTAADKPTAVYRLFNTSGQLLYIGVGSDVGMRFSAHRTQKTWWYDVATIALSYYPTRTEALAAELEAITTEFPTHNTMHSTTKRWPRPLQGEQAQRERLRQIARDA